MFFPLVCLLLGPALAWLGLWCLRHRRSERGRRDRRGTRLLGGHTPGEILLSVNGWPILIVGIALAGLGVAVLPHLATDIARWRYAKGIVVACSRTEASVRNDTGGDLHLRLSRVAVVTCVDTDDIRSTHPIEPFGHGQWLEFVLRPGESARVPLAFPTDLRPCTYDDCRTVEVSFDASGEGPIPTIWSIGPRDVSTQVDCRLP